MNDNLIRDLLIESATKYSEKDYSDFIDETNVRYSSSSSSRDDFFDREIDAVLKRLSKTTIGRIWIKCGAFDVLNVDGFSWVYDTVIAFDKLSTEKKYRNSLIGGDVKLIFDEFFELMFQRLELINLKNIIPIKEDIVMYRIKPEILKEELFKRRFFELEKVSVLSKEKQDQLIQLIATNNKHYQIAFIDFLGFSKYILDHFGHRIGKKDELISKILDLPKDEVKRQFNYLTSGKHTERYLAFSYKNNVEQAYQKLLN